MNAAATEISRASVCRASVPQLLQRPRAVVRLGTGPGGRFPAPKSLCIRALSRAVMAFEGKRRPALRIGGRDGTCAGRRRKMRNSLGVRLQECARAVEVDQPNSKPRALPLHRN